MRPRPGSCLSSRADGRLAPDGGVPGAAGPGRGDPLGIGIGALGVLSEPLMVPGRAGPSGMDGAPEPPPRARPVPVAGAPPGDPDPPGAEDGTEPPEAVGACRPGCRGCDRGGCDTGCWDG